MGKGPSGLPADGVRGEGGDGVSGQRVEGQKVEAADVRWFSSDRAVHPFPATPSACLVVRCRPVCLSGGRHSHYYSLLE